MPRWFCYLWPPCEPAPPRPKTTGASPAPTLAIPHSPRLQQIVDGAVERALERFAPQKLTTNQIAVTLVDLRDPQKPAQASYRGGEQIYPASVIKLFYLAAVHRWLEDGKLKDTDELRRAMRDMIVDSLNEATGYLVDLPHRHHQRPGTQPAGNGGVV